MSDKNNLSWFRFLRPTLTALTEGLRSQTISPADMVLYLVLRSEAARSEQGYKHGEVSLSIRQLIALTGFSRSTVKRSLMNLSEEGYLLKRGIYGKTGVYVARDVAPINGTEVATWDYVPRHETQMIKELSEYVRGDVSEPPANVSIENLSINIQVNNNFYAAEQPHSQSGIGLQSMIDMIDNPQTPPALRQKLIGIYTQLTGDLGHQ